MLKSIGLYVFGIIIICAVVILQFLPNLPSTVLGWIFLLVLGPPLYLLGEWFFEKVFSTERGRRMSDKRFFGKKNIVRVDDYSPFSFFDFYSFVYFRGCVKGKQITTLNPPLKPMLNLDFRLRLSPSGSAA